MTDMKITSLAPIARWVSSVLLISLLLTVASAARAQAEGPAGDPPARVGRLADVQGSAWVFDAEAGEWQAAHRNRPLTTSDRIATDAAARAELSIGPSIVRLGSGSELEILQLDDAGVRLQLHSGSLALRLRSPEAARQFELVTGEGRLVPLRAGHYRVDHNDDVTTATVWEGSLHFEASDSALDVAAGQRVQFWRDGPTRYSTGAPVVDAFDEWARSLDAGEMRMVSTRYVSPEMTGYEDLDRYGNWDTSPDYGPVWIPTAVAADWAPYRFGHWVWVQPWGWSWVDDAPWGFAPFHYGRWVWLRSRWCWTPGHYVARPVYAPALVGWVGGPQVSLSLAIGSPPPPVGWFPLAPREVYVPAYRHSPRYVRNVNITQVTNITVIEQAERNPARQFANRGVGDAVTVVPADVFRQRRPVAPAILRGSDAQQVAQADVRRDAPVARPAPVARFVPGVTPVPSPPGRPADARRDQGDRFQRGQDAGTRREGMQPSPAAIQAPAPQAQPQARDQALREQQTRQQAQQEAQQQARDRQLREEQMRQRGQQQARDQQLREQQTRQQAQQEAQQQARDPQLREEQMRQRGQQQARDQQLRDQQTRQQAQQEAQQQTRDRQLRDEQSRQRVQQQARDQQLRDQQTQQQFREQQARESRDERARIAAPAPQPAPAAQPQPQSIPAEGRKQIPRTPDHREREAAPSPQSQQQGADQRQQRQ
jgi:hypothetical protein